jgi:hypothetical protein
MASLASAGTETAAQLGPLARILGIFYRPGATFADIARRPTFILPMLLVTLAALATGLLLQQKANWAEYERQTEQANPAFSRLSRGEQDEYLARRIHADEKYAWITVSVQVPVLEVAAAFFYWLAFNAIAGAKLRFKTAVAVESYALLPNAVAFVIWIAALIPKAPASLTNFRILRTGLSSYLSPSAPGWLQMLAGSVELFWFWTMILAAIGFAVAAAPKVSKRVSWTIVFGLWIAYVAAKVGWALLFGY